MSLQRFSRILFSRYVQPHRGIHLAALNANRPSASSDVGVIGYRQIEKRAHEAGEDPFDSLDRDKPHNLKGSGTKSDPFLVPSRNHMRCVTVQLGEESAPPHYFWVTKDEGGRDPITGKHFKLDFIEGDKWGIDELDLFKH
ncbi:cytochrome c oxidase subunit 5B, mitochondrial-like [Styela clava]